MIWFILYILIGVAISSYFHSTNMWHDEDVGLMTLVILIVWPIISVMIIYDWFVHKLFRHTDKFWKAVFKRREEEDV